MSMTGASVPVMVASTRGRRPRIPDTFLSVR
jgi:hypothetical protein